MVKTKTFSDIGWKSIISVQPIRTRNKLEKNPNNNRVVDSAIAKTENLSCER